MTQTMMSHKCEWNNPIPLRRFVEAYARRTREYWSNKHWDPQRTELHGLRVKPKKCWKWHQSMASYSKGRGWNILCPLLVEIKSYCDLKVQFFPFLLQWICRSCKWVLLVGSVRWNLIYCISLMPRCHHIKETWRNSKEVFDLFWPF